MSEVCYSYNIQGIVQGVYYRANTQKKANELGLKGWVRNEPDGSVSAVACGETAQLEVFEKWLWQGPDAAKVTLVLAEPTELEKPEDFTGFKVLED
jgi:acylphosphatase